MDKASGKEGKASDEAVSGQGGAENSGHSCDMPPPQKPLADSTQRYKQYLAAAVFLITFVVYLKSLSNGFVSWDDGDYVYANNHIRSFNLAFFRWAFFEFYAWNWHPLTWMSHALDYAIWGLNPLGHHLTNNILHAVNSSIVVVLVIRLVKAWNETRIKKCLCGVWSGKKTLVAAAVTGLLFGLHPIHVESAAWISERKDLLCALFFLLSISSYVKYLIHNYASPAQGATTLFFLNRSYLYAIGFFALALLSKPMAVSLPLVLLLLDWYPFSRGKTLKALKTVTVEKIPFFVLALISSTLTILAQKPFAEVGYVHPPLTVRLFIAFDSLTAYLWKMIVPLDLIPFYPLPGPKTFSPSNYFLPIAFVIGISAICLALLKSKRRMWLAAWCYYVITLLPVLGIVQVGPQAMAYRYTYLPSLAVFLVVGVSAAWLFEKTNALKRGKRLVRAVSVVAAAFVFVSLSFLTVRQIGIWKNDFELWNYQIEKEPEKLPSAYKMRGSTFYWKKGQFDNAIADFNEAIALDPSDFQTYYLRGMAYEGKGEIDDAIADYGTAIVLNPSFDAAYGQRALAYEKKGQIDMAIADLEKAIIIRPSSVETHIRLGVLYGKAGFFERAIVQFGRAIYLNPQYSVPYTDRGYAYFLSSQYDKALKDFEKAIVLNKANSAAYLNRGNLYLKMGKDELAISDFQKACDLKNESGCNALRGLQQKRAR